MNRNPRRFARPITCVAVLALVVAGARPTEAQRPGEPSRAAVSRPIAPAPDSTPVVRAPLARETTPRAIEGLPRHLPAVIPVEQYVIVVSTTWSHDWAARDSADGDLLRCAATLGLARDTARVLLERRPWRAFDEVAGGAPYVLFQAMPNDIPTAACARDRLYDPRYLQRGIALATASLLNPDATVSDVDVFADDEFRSPAIYGRARVAATEWFRAPDRPVLPPPPIQQVRVYLPMDALDPRGGQFPTVMLRVWKDYVKVVMVPVARPLTRRLWHELVPWRLERARGAVPAGADVPAVATPDNAVLRAAVQRYRRGEMVDAAERAAAWRALDRAKTGGVDTTHTASLRRDRLIADVMIGGVLAAAGDTVAATPFVDDALATTPCLVPSTPATGTYARVVSSRRRNVRCAGLPLSAVARRGLMFPGGGHSIAGDKGLAASAVAAVALTLGAAGVATLEASRRYDAYKDATSVESARRRYASAASMRDLGVGLVIGSAAVWLADMGYAVVREKRRTARIRAEGSFGRERCVDAAAGCAR